jgi:hypothetical protein
LLGCLEPQERNAGIFQETIARLSKFLFLCGGANEKLIKCFIYINHKFTQIFLAQPKVFRGRNGKIKKMFLLY